jgi:hypothetical protein
LAQTGTAAPAAERLIRQTSRAIGRISAPARMLPSFLIVGAQRCGTTSLYKALAQHPAVLPAVLHKGVHYFDTGYANGPAWYRGHFPLSLTAQLVHRRLRVRPVTGESSPYYMFHPLAAERIARDLEGVRLIVALRDPVERAYSAHAHELARGYEAEPFEKALELERQRLAGETEKIVADPGYRSFHHQHHGYLARGRYIEQLERLESVFGRHRIHVVDSELFFSRPQPVYDALLDFLHLPGWQHVRFDQHNARVRTAMPASLRKQLQEYFQPYDERLALWLGTEPCWRR